MAPNLLAKMEVECLEGFFSGLVASKTGPFMVAPIGTELGLGQISFSLMQPIKRTVHISIMGFLCFCGQLLRQSAAKLVLLLFSGQFSSYEA